MDKFYDSLAENHRISVAVVTAIAVAVIAAYAIFSSNNIAERQSVHATVTGVELRSDSSNIAFIKLMLPEGQEIKIFSAINPLPAVGETMPLTLEIYNNDKKQYWIDHNQWQNEKLSL